MILEIKDPSHFLTLLETLKPISPTEIHFIVGEKFVFNEMNASRTAMVYCALNREYFEGYDVPEETHFAVSPDDLFKTLGMFTKFKKVKLELQTGIIELYASEGKSRKKAKISLIDSEGENNRPKVEYRTILKIPSGDFKTSLQDCANYGDTVTLSNTQEEFKIYAESEDHNGRNEDAWTITDDLIMVLQENSVQEYILSDLVEMSSRGGKLSKFVTISYENNKPIKLGYMIEHGVLEYFTAPVVR